MRHFALNIFLTLATVPLFAQVHEVGAWGGIAHYFGDLNINTSVVYARPSTGVYYRYNIKQRGAWRSNVGWGWLEFRDDATKVERNLQRNLSFRSQVFEVSTGIEFYFLKFDKTKKGKWFTPYMGVGAGVFFFNPQAEYNGRWIDLQPLGTEGQNDPSYSGAEKYRLFSFCIPITGGFKFSLPRGWNIGIEAGVRKTFTDYLDDVSGNYPSYASLPGGSTGLAAALSDRSGELNGAEKSGRPGYQRGQSPKKDDYLFGGITISYTFMDIICPSPATMR